MSDPRPLPTPSLGRAMAAGGAWTVVETLSGSLLATVILLLLAKLVGPEAYGLVGMAVAIIAILQVTVTEGLATAVVQRPDLSHGHLDSIFWLNSAVGVILCGSLAAAADTLATLMGEATLGPVFQVLSLSLLCHALVAVPTEKLRRDFQFRWLALRPIAGNLVAGVVGLGLAMAGLGLWAIVAYQLVRSLVYLAVVFIGSRWRPRLYFRWGCVADRLRFSADTVGVRFLIILSQRSLVLVGGLVIGPAAAGYLRLAEQILDMTTLLTVTPLNRVALPGFSRVQQDRSRLAHFYLKMVGLAALVTLPLASFLIIALPDLIGAAFGEAWGPSALAAQIALAGTPGLVLFFHLGTAFLSINRSGLALQQTSVQFGVTLGCYLMAAPFGFFALAVAHGVRTLLTIPYRARLLERHLGIRFGTLIRRLLPPSAAAAAMLVAMVAVAHGLADAAAVLRLAAEATVGFAVYGLVLRFCWPSVVADAVRLAPSPLLNHLARIPILRYLLRS